MTPDEPLVDQEETDTLMRFNLIVYALPVIPGPPPAIRPAVPPPFLPLCQTCGVRGCPVAHPRPPRRRWWHRR